MPILHFNLSFVKFLYFYFILLKFYFVLFQDCLFLFGVLFLGFWFLDFIYTYFGNSYLVVLLESLKVWSYDFYICWHSLAQMHLVILDCEPTLRRAFFYRNFGLPCLRMCPSRVYICFCHVSRDNQPPTLTVLISWLEDSRDNQTITSDDQIVWGGAVFPTQILVCGR